MIDGLTSSRLFQYMRQAVAQPVAPVAPAYAADRWVPSQGPAGWQAYWQANIGPVPAGVVQPQAIPAPVAPAQIVPAAWQPPVAPSPVMPSAWQASPAMPAVWQAPVPPPPPPPPAPVPPAPPVPPPPPAPAPIEPAAVDPAGLWNQLTQRYNSLLSDKAYVEGLYREILGREPDASGLIHHLFNLENGRTRDQLRQDFLDSAEYKQKQAPAPAPAANLPPITIDLVRQVAHEYVNQHPEIKDLPSYEAREAVSQLREGVIAELNRRGYKAGRILGPDGVPYDQCVAFGNAGDVKANAYRVTAGGGRIERAIDAGYCDDPIAWADVH